MNEGTISSTLSTCSARRKLLLLLLSLLALAAASDGALAQATWYVDDDNCPGPGSGTEEDPFCSVQDGIDAAKGGDEVLVSPGTYNELIDFHGKAITLRSSGGRDVTIIDAGPVPDPGTGSMTSGCQTRKATRRRLASRSWRVYGWRSDRVSSTATSRSTRWSGGKCRSRRVVKSASSHRTRKSGYSRQR